MMLWPSYRALSWVLRPLVPVLLARRAKRGKEDASRLSERYGIPSAAAPKAPVIWLHAASVGETQSVLPLLGKLREAKPDYHILITTGTRTSANMLKGRLSEGMSHQYIPLDIPAYVQRFLRHWKPQLALWVESEFWPHLLQQTAAKNIPIMLVNGRISKRSFARWSRYPKSIRVLLDCFAATFAGSKDDMEHLQKLGAKQVQYAGNVKSDAAPLPIDPVAATVLERGIGERPFWLAASTHDGEEAMVGYVHAALKASRPDLLTLLVPRHAARGAMIAAELEALGLRTARRSMQQSIAPDTDIYIADTMGELGTFYHLSPVTFIGGSLVAHGGHNPLEPARHDCAVISGPHVFNFQQIYDELREVRALTMVADSEALVSALGHGLDTPDIHVRTARIAREFVDTKRGATEAVIAEAVALLAEGKA